VNYFPLTGLWQQQYLEDLGRNTTLEKKTYLHWGEAYISSAMTGRRRAALVSIDKDYDHKEPNLNENGMTERPGNVNRRR
jgi:hypothetical protein